MDRTTTRSVTAVLDGPPYRTQLSTRGHEWIADEPEDEGGADLGPRPHEFMLAALASCTAITLRMYADRKQWAIGPIRITTTMDRTQRGAEVQTLINIEVELDPSVPQEQRERLAVIARSCPVHRTLENPIQLRSAVV
ncbi:MAG TPA: OsmC family protein [Flavobacteriales bacterium]|nr:OsmC family protein [Flavobacteriales bacterium]